MFRTLRGIMAAMRRVLTYLMVWGGATTLAMLLVWFAARPVLHNAVFGEPPVRQVVGDAPSASPSMPLPSTLPPADSSTVATVSPSPSSSTAPAAPVTHDHTYVTRGGRVVLTFTSTAAKLVSAVPSPGYEVRTWHGIGWLRVEFMGGRHGSGSSGVLATWNDHPPDVIVHG
jgi:hypothetical protein